MRYVPALIMALFICTMIFVGAMVAEPDLGRAAPDAPAAHDVASEAEARPPSSPAVQLPLELDTPAGESPAH